MTSVNRESSMSMCSTVSLGYKNFINSCCVLMKICRLDVPELRWVYTEPYFEHLSQRVTRTHVRQLSLVWYNDRTRNVLVLLVLVGKGDPVQVSIRCVVIFVGFNTP